MSGNQRLTTIFIVGPIGEKGSAERATADTLKNEIIVPAAEEAFGDGAFTLERADDIGDPGRISLQVLERLVVSDIAIVDLTGLNPNVMYELGVRQARLKPYILLRPESQPLPFDIADVRAISYDFSLTGGKKAIKSLVSMLKTSSQSITATDTLLFDTGSDAGKANITSPLQQRIQVQILDQLSTLREGQEALMHGVSQLMKQEERQRADAAEYRQQELGMRLVETMVGSNPDAVMALIQHFSGQGITSGGPAIQTAEPTQLNRQQRRAAAKKHGPT